MSNKKETAAERIERLKREKAEANEASSSADLVSQLTHEDTETDFSAIAEKLRERNGTEKVSVMENTVKMTIYVDKELADAFNALCVKRGDQRRYVNDALKTFVERKAKELGL